MTLTASSDLHNPKVVHLRPGFQVKCWCSREAAKTSIGTSFVLARHRYPTIAIRFGSWRVEKSGEEGTRGRGYPVDRVFSAMAAKPPETIKNLRKLLELVETTCADRVTLNRLS
jgi:hypothetical protein